MKLAIKGAEIWAAIYADTDTYKLVVVAKQAMVQKVTANAAVLAQDLKTTGHVAVYGIYFDTGKSEIKPESEPTLAEIAKLLQQNPNLKLYVVGHTDNVGELLYNMKLSQDRAGAVVNALVFQYSVTASRLVARGTGPLAPVASNKTEDGRAQNRRVELVEQ
jgi:outer membrane protein OmpA-like peptidoglycan-associated protein